MNLYPLKGNGKKQRYEIICSAFDKKGRLICSVSNSYTESCSLMRFYAIKTGNLKNPYNHAEIACIDKAIKLRKVIDRLVVIRYDCNGNFKDCKPCKICQAAIQDFNIKSVMYSTSEGMKEL